MGSRCLADLVANVESGSSLSLWQQRTVREREQILIVELEQYKEVKTLLFDLMRAAVDREAMPVGGAHAEQKDDDAGVDLIDLRPEWIDGKPEDWYLRPHARILRDKQGPLLLHKLGTARIRRDHLQHAKTLQGLLLRYGSKARWRDLLSICYVAMEMQWAKHLEAAVVAKAPRRRQVRAGGSRKESARQKRAAARARDAAEPTRSAAEAERLALCDAALAPIQCAEGVLEHLWILGTFLHFSVAPGAGAPRTRSAPPRRCPERTCWACGRSSLGASSAC
jgi:hypothetical protein